MECLKTSMGTHQGWAQPIFSLFLALIHHIVDVLTQIRLCASIFVKKISSTYDINKDFHVLQRHHLEKVPGHIALAFLETSISLPEVAKLVVWSIAFGARSISIYDLRGYVKSHQHDLKHYIQELLKCLDHQPFHIHWNPNDDFVSLNWKAAVHLRLLSKEDGQEDIVEAAKRLAQNVANGYMTPEDVNEEALEANLGLASQGLPGDPEVLVRFGLAHSNLGYPPWQIRLSEIHDIDTHHGVSRADFFHVVSKYSKCHQRFGR